MTTEHTFVREDTTFMSEGAACAAWLYRPDGDQQPANRGARARIRRFS